MDTPQRKKNKFSIHVPTPATGHRLKAALAHRPSSRPASGFVAALRELLQLQLRLLQTAYFRRSARHHALETLRNLGRQTVGDSGL